ncbi:hypothetical protein HDG40_006512 [Paraburkholderia sp. JPY158]|uniref:Uncharacterized protein n=1 Tax=Paraburkholderia atlantica TaxID=2654982 RepID=A0A7W8QEQ4_PARAM|nr:hypothetical protein [Paraburkholderia atlantica]
MPLPNGVDPTGTIHPVCPSAGWMGNRGLLHDREGRVVRDWRIRAWITCRPAYKNWSRKPLMQPGKYTELFFLDEATALSAGHRPCAMCRRADYLSFKAHWLSANRFTSDMTAQQMDAKLHIERFNRGTTSEWRQSLQALPAGVFVIWDGVPHLWNGTRLFRWTDTGYVDSLHPEIFTVTVELLTPPSVSKAIRHGYAVQLHPTTSIKTHTAGAYRPGR